MRPSRSICLSVCLLVCLSVLFGRRFQMLYWQSSVLLSMKAVGKAGRWHWRYERLALEAHVSYTLCTIFTACWGSWRGRVGVRERSKSAAQEAVDSTLISINPYSDIDERNGAFVVIVISSCYCCCSSFGWRLLATCELEKGVSAVC